MGELSEEIMKATQGEVQQEDTGRLRPGTKKSGRNEYSSTEEVLLRRPGDPPDRLGFSE